MVAPDIETSTREERLEFIREEFKCLGNCPICGKCSFLRGREAEDLYADYIEGHRSFRDITAEHRNNNIKQTTTPMKETIAKINEVIAALQADLAKAAEGNKAAAARARKSTLELEKLGKAFRKQSIAEL